MIYNNIKYCILYINITLGESINNSLNTLYLETFNLLKTVLLLDDNLDIKM